MLATTTQQPERRQPGLIVGHFEPIARSHGAFALTVFTEEFPIAGNQLFARVARQPLKGVIGFRGGFSGRLDRPPSEGDRLYLRYSGSIEVPTPVVYHGEAPRVA